MSYYAVIDTNVIVSAMLKKNTPPDQVLRKVFAGSIVPLLNQEILDEYWQVLSRDKFGFSDKAVKIMITGIIKGAVFLNAAPLEEVLPDTKDTVFYELVMEGRKFSNAYLITGNLKHFPQRSYIVDPREMIRIIESMG